MTQNSKITLPAVMKNQSKWDTAPLRSAANRSAEAVGAIRLNMITASEMNAVGKKTVGLMSIPPQFRLDWP